MEYILKKAIFSSINQSLGRFLDKIGQKSLVFSSPTGVTCCDRSVFIQSSEGIVQSPPKISVIFTKS